MTRRLVDLSPIPRARFPKESDRRAGIDDHHPWHALPPEPRDGSDAGEIVLAGGARPRRSRDRGRFRVGWTARRWRIEPAFGRRGEASRRDLAASSRAAVRPEPQWRDDVYRDLRWNRNFRDRPASAACIAARGDVRHFRRSRRTLAHQSRVVCAGANRFSISTRPRYLESQGVAVCGYRCDEFPAFYARSSGSSSTTAAMERTISRA